MVPHRTFVYALPLLALLTAPTPAQQPTATPTFTEDVAPIVFTSCARCHRPGEAAPFSLLTYADTKKRGRNLATVCEDRYMPPWHPEPGYGSFRNEARLSDAQIATLRAWVDGGMPEGPPDRLPPAPAFTPGWQLGEPDLVVEMAEPYVVPAAGPDIYRDFTIPLDLPEDRWVAAIEVRPSARAVLHHVLIFADDAPADGGRRRGTDAARLLRTPLLAGWAVGGMPERLPDGLALRVAKGSSLVLQSHFHPSGKRESERTRLGIYFAKKPPERTLTAIQLPPFFGLTAGLEIAAGEADHHLTDAFTLPCAVDAITVGGHAHMLCRSLWLRGEAPDGSEVPLLKIPAWDFDWQNRYTYSKSVRLPAGTVLRADLTYDNSAANPNNPNTPPRRVRWGRETTDEMGSITLMVTPADEADAARLQAAIAEHNTSGAVARVKQFVDEQFDRYDADRDGFLSADELPQRMRAFLGRLDRDGDGKLSRSEAESLGRMLGGGRGR